MLADATNGDSPTLKKAIEAYDAGRLETSVALLLQDLKDNPDSGTAHVYLQRAMARMGQGPAAVAHLETAVRLSPPEAIQALAKQAVTDEPQQKPPTDFWGQVMQFMSGRAPNGQPPQIFGVPIQMPNLLSPVSDALKNGKNWLREQARTVTHQPPPYQSPDGVADIMPMGKLLDLAEQAQTKNPKWSSNPASPVMRFAQAPENSREWDQWILRFRRNLSKLVFRHLAHEAGTETGGAANIIFSVDKAGHLRACIYQSTADDTINNSLLAAIRDLDMHYSLHFPANSHITGWNFHMHWNFVKALAVIQTMRNQYKFSIAHSPMIRVLTDARMMTRSAQIPQLAKAQKLAVPKEDTSLKAAAPVMTVKTGVSAMILPKPKPLELKAKALKLTDLPPVKTDQTAAPVIDIPDEALPKGDVSGLFN